jgi:hypothetical protein
MDDASVVDAFLDSPAVSLTTKRRLALVNVFLRDSVATYFGGELGVVHVHLGDCTLANVEFVLHALFPKNYQLAICARDEKHRPKLHLGAVVNTSREMGAGSWSWHLGDAAHRMTYTAAYFLGHLLVDHCLDCLPSVVSTRNAKLLLHDFRDAGQYERHAAHGHDADRGILHAPMMRVAEAVVRTPDAEEWNHQAGELRLSAMGLNADSLRNLAPLIRKSVLEHEIALLALDRNHFGPRGARALFGVKGTQWRFLAHLALGHTGLGTAGCEPLFDAIRSNAMPELGSLSLQNTELDDEGACMLWRVAPRLRKLSVLNLSQNLFGPDGLAPLNRHMHGEWLPKLRVLNMERMPGMGGSNTTKSDMALARAVAGGRFPALRYCTVPAAFHSTRLALKAVVRERASRRARERVEACMARASGGAAQKKRPKKATAGRG